MSQSTVTGVMTAVPERTPRGYLPGLAIASFGVYLAVLTPTVGGLSVKVQGLVGIADAPAQLGLVLGVGALFALFVQPLAGRLSDRTTSRWGMRRPWILFGLIGMVIALIGCAFAPNIPLLLISWCAAQTFGNFIFAAQSATIADQVPEPKRGAVSGIVGAVTPIGLLVGAILLSVLPNDQLRFIVPAIVGLVVGLWFILFVLKDRVRENAPVTKLNLGQVFSSFVFNPRRHPDFGWAWISKLLIMLAFGGSTGYLTLYLGDQYGMNTTEQLAFNAQASGAMVVALVVFSVIGGLLSDRVGRRKPFVIAAGFIMTIGIAGLGLSFLFGDAGLTVILIAMGVVGAGAGAFLAVDQALCIAVLPSKDDTAKDLGVLNIANTLPTSIAPFLAGVVIIPLGNALFAGTGYVLWFFVSALFAIIGSLLVTPIKAVK